MGLLNQIESEAMDGDVVKALRLCIKLGGHSGSDTLREWASRELNGHDSVSELPDYRLVDAALYMDYLSPRMKGSLPVPVSALPEWVQEAALGELPLRQSIPVILSMARQSDPVKMMPRWGAEAARHMNASGVTEGAYSLYWAVSEAVICGVIERVRTDLIRLVNEIRPSLNDDLDIPSAEMASQALNVVISGDNNRLAVGSIEQTGNVSTVEKSPRRRKLEIAYWVAGVAIAAVAIVTLILRLV